MKVAGWVVKNELNLFFSAISVMLDPLFGSLNCIASLYLMMNDGELRVLVDEDHGVRFGVMWIEG